MGNFQVTTTNRTTPMGRPRNRNTPKQIIQGEVVPPLGPGEPPAPPPTAAASRGTVATKPKRRWLPEQSPRELTRAEWEAGEARWARDRAKDLALETKQTGFEGNFPDPDETPDRPLIHMNNGKLSRRVYVPKESQAASALATKMVASGELLATSHEAKEMNLDSTAITEAHEYPGSTVEPRIEKFKSVPLRLPKPHRQEVKRLKKTLKQVPRDSDDARQIKQNITNAKVGRQFATYPQVLLSAPGAGEYFATKHADDRDVKHLIRAAKVAGLPPVNAPAYLMPARRMPFWGGDE